MHFVVDWYYRYRYMQCVNARVDFINLLVVGTRNRVLAARRCLSARIVSRPPSVHVSQWSNVTITV